ncbi:hypothetical protein TL16_g13278, partial [Triparma laevis f. inornata]
LAKKGQIESSLQYFRAAVRADPTNYEYMNNLGVTEMRTQSFRKASYRFFNSLKLSSGEYAKAWKNLEELQEFVSEDDYITYYHDWLGLRDDNLPVVGVLPDIEVSYGIRHKTKTLPIIDYETFFDPSNETARSYATGYKPYMLINGMDHWDLDVLGNRDVMIEHFKDSRVDYYPHNMREEDVRPYFNDLASAIGNFDNPTGLFDRIDASERTAYIQWNMKDNEWKKMKELGMDLPPMFRSDDVWIDKCFAPIHRIDDFLVKTHWRMVLIGQEGAGMFNHKDTLHSASFQAQLSGRKRWHLCSDAYDEQMYKAGQVNTFSPNYSKFPKALDMDCYDVTVETGQMLYYPQNYWHQTRNLDPFTMSVSGTLVTDSNKNEISHEFRKECNPGKTGSRIFSYEERLCEGLQQCMDHWQIKSWEEDVTADFETIMKNKKLEL